MTNRFEPIGGSFTKEPSPEVFLLIAQLVETSEKAARYALNALKLIQQNQRKASETLHVLIGKFEDYCAREIIESIFPC